MKKMVYEEIFTEIKLANEMFFQNLQSDFELQTLKSQTYLLLMLKPSLIKRKYFRKAFYLKKIRRDIF